MLVDQREVKSHAAREVLQILDRGDYVAPSGASVSIRAAQTQAEAGTVLYTPERLSALRQTAASVDGARLPARSAVEFVDATTQQAGQTLAREGDVVLLNFASARNPGGGFLRGAKAQEEDLCRCSGLYRTLVTQSEYYTVNRAQRSLLYSDYLIYSPCVPFFRMTEEAPLLETPFYASVITAPAPNAREIRRNQPENERQLRPTFVRRWQNVLAVAEDRGHRAVLLGAWGCGAFGNDPALVAETVGQALAEDRFDGVFSRIVFAIPGFNRVSERNLAQFRAVLSEANSED